MKELLQINRTIIVSNYFKIRNYYYQFSIIGMFNHYFYGKFGQIERENYANFLFRVINLVLWLRNYINGLIVIGDIL